jgi:hypothetical protein
MSAVSSARRLPGLDLAWLAAGCGLALLHALHLASVHHPSDDAFITFRYVHNLVAGRGVVFNPGEYVMGYSNPAWLLLLAPLHAAGLEAPLAARILGTLLVWGTLARVYSFLRREHGSSWPAVAALAVLVPNGTLAVWMLGGLEGPLITFALACGTCAAMRLDAGSSPGDYVRAGAWFALAAWTRPEGILFGLAVGVTLWLRPATRGWYAALLVATVGAAYLALLACTLLYYGDPLPNTYYAKVHTVSVEMLVRGAAQAASFLSSYLFAPLLILVLWAASRSWRRDGRGLHALAGIVAFTAFFLYVGGDTLEYHRLWLVLLPLFALLFGDAVAAIGSVGRPAAHAPPRSSRSPASRCPPRSADRSSSRCATTTRSCAISR